MAAAAGAKTLLPKIESYFTGLAGSLFRGDRKRDQAIRAFAEWIHRQRSQETTSVIVICSGNSRRSFLTAALGNAASLSRGLAMRFHSGGTMPSAIHPSAIEALRDAGFVIDASGESSGAPRDANPIYRVRWSVESGLPPQTADAIEFSKKFDDPANPQSGFAALMVCDEADRDCPVVPGALMRFAMPFADPKSSDGLASERAVYAQRRDEIARTMCGVFDRVSQIGQL